MRVCVYAHRPIIRAVYSVDWKRLVAFDTLSLILFVYIGYIRNADAALVADGSASVAKLLHNNNGDDDDDATRSILLSH